MAESVTIREKRIIILEIGGVILADGFFSYRQDCDSPYSVQQAKLVCFVQISNIEKINLTWLVSLLT